MVDALYDEERREVPPFSINIFDYYRLFLITRLYKFTSSTLIGTCNYHRGADNAYYKARLIKVIEVVIKNTIFGLYVLYKGKPFANELRIFVEGPLEVVYVIKTRL